MSQFNPNIWRLVTDADKPVVTALEYVTKPGELEKLLDMAATSLRILLCSRRWQE